MRYYFTYSPLDMSEQAAYERALPYLNERFIAHVHRTDVQVEPQTPGVRPQAKPDTYLVLVEQDGSRRVVHTALS